MDGGDHAHHQLRLLRRALDDVRLPDVRQRRRGERRRRHRPGIDLRMEVLLLLLLLLRRLLLRLRLRGLPDGDGIGVLQDRIEALAVGKAVGIVEAEDCCRVRVFSAVAERLERLPQERVQLERLPVGGRRLKRPTEDLQYFCFIDNDAPY